MITPEDRLRIAAEEDYERPGGSIAGALIVVALGVGIWAFALGFMAGYLVGRG